MEIFGQILAKHWERLVVIKLTNSTSSTVLIHNKRMPPVFEINKNDCSKVYSIPIFKLKKINLLTLSMVGLQTNVLLHALTE